MDVSIDNCSFEHSDSVGLAYGVCIVYGCDRVRVSNSEFFDMRHGVSVGGSTGVDRNIVVTGCNCIGMTDAGLDAHPQADNVVFNGNTIAADATSETQDGIVMQCAHCVCSNNIVRGFSRTGILIQNLVLSASVTADHPIVSGNIVTQPWVTGSTAYGIVIENQRTPDYMRFSVIGNTVDVTETAASVGIYINGHIDGSTIYGGTISGNSVHARYQSIFIYTATDKSIQGLAISGNSLETNDTTTYDCIKISATTGAGIKLCVITGNYIAGGKYGINNDNGQNIQLGTNTYNAPGTGNTNGTFV